MRDQFLKVPFASGGDKTAIPDATQPDGSISMQQGWGNDYTLEVGVDPAAKSVDRQHMNQVLYLATKLLNRWQTESFPEWIDSASNGGVPYSYAKTAVVRYSPDGILPYDVWINLVEGNTTSPSVANGWALMSNLFSAPTETVRGSPLVATSAEAIALTLAGKMIDPAKLGAVLGAWVIRDYGTGRSLGVTYTNTSKALMIVNIQGATTIAAGGVQLNVGGFPVIGSSYPDIGRSVAVTAAVPPGATYVCPPGQMTIARWTEVSL